MAIRRMVTKILDMKVCQNSLCAQTDGVFIMYVQVTETNFS